MTLLFGLACLVVAVAGAAALPSLAGAPATSLTLLAVALVGAAVVLRGAARAVEQGAAGARRTGRLLLWGLVALRALGLLGVPTLSDDFHRYVHEGRASRLGLAVPYETPPRDITPPPDDGTTAQVNHSDVPAAYPPGSQLVLWATVGVGDALKVPRAPLRLLLVLCDLAVLVVLFRRRREHPLAFVRYGVHPLPLLEIAIGAHLDAMGMALLLLALLSSAPVTRGLLIGAAAHVKPVALLAILSTTRPQALRVCVGLAAGLLLPALLHLAAGAPILRGTVEYGTRWRAAPFVYGVLEAALAPRFEARAARGTYAHLHLGLDPPGLLVEENGAPLVAWGQAEPRPTKLLLDHRFVARLGAGALLALCLALLVWRVRDPVLRVAWALAAFWLLTPTVHPWYLLWIVPLAALSSSRALWLFSASAPVLYQSAVAAAATGRFEEALWPRGVMLGALLVGAVLDRGARR